MAVRRATSVAAARVVFVSGGALVVVETCRGRRRATSGAERVVVVKRQPRRSLAGSFTRARAREQARVRAPIFLVCRARLLLQRLQTSTRARERARIFLLAARATQRDGNRHCDREFVKSKIVHDSCRPSRPSIRVHMARRKSRYADGGGGGRFLLANCRFSAPSPSSSSLFDMRTCVDKRAGRSDDWFYIRPEAQVCERAKCFDLLVSSLFIYRRAKSSNFRPTISRFRRTLATSFLASLIGVSAKHFDPHFGFQLLSCRTFAKIKSSHTRRGSSFYSAFLK